MTEKLNKIQLAKLSICVLAGDGEAKTMLNNLGIGDEEIESRGQEYLTRRYEGRYHHPLPRTDVLPRIR